MSNDGQYNQCHHSTDGRCKSKADNQTPAGFIRPVRQGGRVRATPTSLSVVSGLVIHLNRISKLLPLSIAGHPTTGISNRVKRKCYGSKSENVTVMENVYPESGYGH